MAGRYVRVAAPTASPSDAGDDLATALRAAGPAGSLAKVAGGLTDSPGLSAVGTGLSGLLGLTRGIAGGDPGQAIGGGANLGSGLASLAGYPGVASGLGALGGPLTLATGLASGDPLSSTLGGLQTASLASGYLGGPTLSGLASTGLSGLYNLLPGATEAGAAALGLGGATAAGEGAALAGGGIGGSLAGGLALGPFALLAAGGLHALTSGGGDMFDALFGEDHTQPWSQRREYERYADAFPGQVQKRTASAGLFDHLGEEPDLTAALKTAATGAHTDPDAAAWNLSHQPTALPGLKPMNLSGWDAASPELGGHSWAATLSLMDRGQAAGLDAGGLAAGDWNLDPVTPNTTGDEYRTRLGSVGTENQYHGLLPQTQEAQDLGNAVGQIGRHLGVDFGSRGGDPGSWQNFDADQLAGYGLTPGNYGASTLNYLRSFDPGVTANPEWDSYAKALDPGGTLGSLAPLTLTPRKLPTLPGYSAPELNLGGG